MSAGRGWSLLRIGMMAVLILGVGFFVWARLLAGGPVSLIPGGVLSGEVVAEPDFLDEIGFGVDNLLCTAA